MTSSVVTATAATVNLPNHPVVLQPRLLDRSQSLNFQAVLHQALHRAAGVIIDFIWIEAIDPAGVAVLKQAVHLAARLGKSIVFQGASATLSALLEQEQDRLRNHSLGDWQPQCNREFDAFLGHHGEPSETASEGEIVFPQFGLAASQIA
ncbi:MAG: STAS domain-containing protein [Microcoleus sp. SIO2G3]|nr:STAS domain-containing protein [Microcoleus sp. SIO2G3]